MSDRIQTVDFTRATPLAILIAVNSRVMTMWEKSGALPSRLWVSPECFKSMAETFIQSRNCSLLKLIRDNNAAAASGHPFVIASDEALRDNEFIVDEHP